VKLALHHFDLPLQHEFRISRESISVQPTLIVELQADGYRGFGEATTNAYYGVTLESMVQALAGVRQVVESHAADDPEGLWDVLAEPLRDNSFALCAVDQAAHDLHGKILGQPLYRLWGLESGPRPLSNYTIGIDQLDVMVAKLKERPDWPIYKIKLGTDQDLQIVRELRRHTSAVFRVDANCGWTADETIRNAAELVALGVEFIEQPLPAGDWQAQRLVYEQSALPLIADESCIDQDDVARCANHFHGINIKLSKCGGLTPARRMIQHARQLELKVMVGCMTESTVGISAIAQLLPLLDYVDMDGAVLLAADIATGVRVERGVCHYAQENGTGARLIRDQRVEY
jgi:L-alanine-DL-glutamate epimerase-like enolase superfamily enzyme